MGRETEESRYIIFKDGDYCKAKNGITGCIEFSGTDAATVIQSAIDAIPMFGGGKISFSRDVFSLKRGLIIEARYIHLAGQGRFVLTEAQYGTILQKDFDGGSVITIRSTKGQKNMGCHLEEFAILPGTGITTGDGIFITPNNTVNDIGYVGFYLDSLLISLKSTMRPLVILDEPNMSMSYLTAINCWLETETDAEAAIKIRGGPTINMLDFINCKAVGGEHALHAEATTGLVETLTWRGGFIGNSKLFGAYLKGIANSSFINVHFEGNQKQCISLAGSRNVSFYGCRLDGDGTGTTDYPVVISADCEQILFDSCLYDGSPGTAPLFRIESGASGTNIRNCRSAGQRPFASIG